jgi:hypothetical protein
MLKRSVAATALLPRNLQARQRCSEKSPRAAPRLPSPGGQATLRPGRTEADSCHSPATEDTLERHPLQPGTKWRACRRRPQWRGVPCRKDRRDNPNGMAKDRRRRHRQRRFNAGGSTLRAGQTAPEASQRGIGIAGAAARVGVADRQGSTQPGRATARDHATERAATCSEKCPRSGPQPPPFRR